MLKPAVRQVVVTSIKEWLPPLLRVVFTLVLEKKGGHRAVLRDGDPMLPALLAATRVSGPRRIARISMTMPSSS